MNVKPFEALLAVVRFDPGNDVMDVVMDANKVDIRLVTVDPEATACAYVMGGMGGRNQRFGRNAAGVEAVAPHLRLFDKDNFRAHLCRTRGNAQPTGTRTYDTNVGLDEVLHELFPLNTLFGRPRVLPAHS